MKIEILGTGCAKCKKLYSETEKAIAASGRTAQLEKVEEIEAIMARGVIATPALILDGEVKCSGRIPPALEIASWLSSTTSREEA